MAAPATRDLADDGYKLYLAEKYSIQRNDVFEKFVCADKMFPTLADALTHADPLRPGAPLLKKMLLKRNKRINVNKPLVPKTRRLL